MSKDSQDARWRNSYLKNLRVFVISIYGGSTIYLTYKITKEQAQTNKTRLVEFGGTGVYFTAAMGDINPAPDFMWEDKYSSPYASDDSEQYIAAEEYGSALASYAIQALGEGKIFKNLPLKVAKVIVDYPLENPLFVMLVQWGVIQREIIQVGENEYIVRSELSGIKMGPIEMLTVPGELFSSLSLFLKEKMPKYGFLLGLTTEEMGYIIPSEEWGQDPGEIGESLSMGPQTAPIMIENLLQIIDELA